LHLSFTDRDRPLLSGDFRGALHYSGGVLLLPDRSARVDARVHRPGAAGDFARPGAGIDGDGIRLAGGRPVSRAVCPAGQLLALLALYSRWTLTNHVRSLPSRETSLPVLFATLP